MSSTSNQPAAPKRSAILLEEELIKELDDLAARRGKASRNAIAREMLRKGIDAWREEQTTLAEARAQKAAS